MKNSIAQIFPCLILLIFSLIGAQACHSLNNQNDSIAVQCSLGEKTQGRIIIKLMNSGNIELTPEQKASLQLRYTSASGASQAVKASSQACVSLPGADGLLEANIQGENPLSARIPVGLNLVSLPVQIVEMESPGFLDLNLKCPKNGFLASDVLGDIIETKSSQGRLLGYRVELNIFGMDGSLQRTLFLKAIESNKLTLPKSFDLKNLAEGSYKVNLTVQDEYHNNTSPASQSQCGLLIRRTCDNDADFDPETISCAPKLCDNAYRVGAQWTARLSMDRGQGNYECKLEGGIAKKTMLSHSCKAGFFKSDESCLAARKLEKSCALLENDSVNCWGIQLGKDIFPRKNGIIPPDFDYQTTFQFTEPVQDMSDWCVFFKLGKFQCWKLDLDTHYKYVLRDAGELPESWPALHPPGYIRFRGICGINIANEYWCGVSRDGSGGSKINIPEKIIDFSGSCLLDIKGQLWCLKSGVPAEQDLQDIDTESYEEYYKIKGFSEPVLQIEAGANYPHCVRLFGGKVKCWGINFTGATGTNIPKDKIDSPTNVVDSKGNQIDNVIQLTSDSDSNDGMNYCTLQSNGQVFCWGSNLDGKLGSGSPGEDDEGNSLFSRFAVPITIELKYSAKSL